MYQMIIVFVIVLVVGTYLYKAHHMEKIVTRLNEEGWKLYLNANNCGYCHHQLRFLGSHINKMNIYHCDDKQNKGACAKCTALPCWEKNGKQVNGARLTTKAIEELLDSN